MTFSRFLLSVLTTLLGKTGGGRRQLVCHQSSLIKHFDLPSTGGFLGFRCYLCSQFHFHLGITAICLVIYGDTHRYASIFMAFR